MTKYTVLLALLVFNSACTNAYVSVKPIKSAIIPVIEQLVDEKSEDQPQTRKVVYVPKHKERKIAEVTIGFHTAEGVHETTIDIRKDYRGYIAEAPVYEEERFRTSIALSSSKEHKLMLGVKVSWRF